MSFHDKFTILKNLFGYNSFRPGQERMIDDILSGRDCFAVMPTGAGKSCCYQIPALMLPGITLVVSPLISLMKDQVTALKQLGVAAAYLNSSLTPRQFDLALSNARYGLYKIIYVAPERLLTQGFLDFASSVDISLLAVDEAHCVSQWGQDFRPSYLDIPEFINFLAKRPTVAAFTATATEQVREDIVKYLGLCDPDIMVTGFDRDNLYYEVAQPGNKYSALLSYIRAHKSDRGIVYCSTRKTVDELYTKLTADGISAGRYHAGMDDEERRQNQEDFTYDRIDVIAATNAFGMGIDKSDIRYVIHYNMPKNPESYYQEAGRAGRDGAPAECILYYSGQDVIIDKFLIDNSTEGSDLDEKTLTELRERDYKRLELMVEYCMTPDCLRRFILEYFGETKHKPGSCGNCANCLGKYKTTEVTKEAVIALKFIKEFNENDFSFGIGASNLADALKGSRTDAVKRLGLDEETHYSALSHMPLADIRRLIDTLVSRGFLRYSQGKYRTLEIGAEKLKRGEKIYIKNDPRYQGKAGAAKTGETIPLPRDGSAAASLDDAEIRKTDLFERLRALRKKLSDNRGIPPYMVFSDKTLIEIVKKTPRDREQFLSCSGVGQNKYQQFGEEFIREIRSYLSEQSQSKT
ncbi:MAG TPA: DNA helicase RecQ [Clostridiales bacterium]|jgi:ATP-dependent DNA helicase RecQ|nr:DNA helicase RecQ [Clostridiales bacterium]